MLYTKVCSSLQENMNLLNQFERQVKRRPNSPALKLEDKRLLFSFGQIDELARKLQLCLQKQIDKYIEDDVGTPLVAVMMTRSVGFIATILGILKVGAAYVPVDPAFPPDRQSYIFSHSKCQLLVADQDSYRSAVMLGAELPSYMIVDSFTGEVDFAASPLIKAEDFDWNDVKTVIPVEPTRETLAYVLYTSGSTGKPKGVMVKQLSVANIVDWFAEEMNVGPHSIVMGLTTFCFDISVLEIFLPLTRGGLLVLADSLTQKDPFRLLEMMAAFKVSVFQATPTTYEMMLATGWKGDPNIDFLVGGEAFRPSLLPIADKAGGRCKSLRNVYGPTETTIWSLSYTVPQDLAMASTFVQVPIGSAISRTSLYVVAEKLNPQEAWREVEFGAEGELWIGGIGVAKGYLHAPDLTQNRFLSNPFGEGVVYRTGDIVKQLPQPGAEFVFVRRIDDQVKVDGFRIELAEIEAVYMQQDAVEQAVALVRKNKLFIYLKLTAEGRSSSDKKGEGFLLEDLRKTAARSLTYYMVPKHSIIVTSFPQTANGKIDRKALPDPPSLTDTVTEVVARAPYSYMDPAQAERPSGSLVAHISAVIEKLRDQRPGPNSSFAILGLDSLGSVMFVRALSVSLDGMRIDPTTLYSPGVTIQSFANQLRDRLTVENPALLEMIESQEYDEPKESNSNTAPSDAENAFDDVMVSNVRLMQGIRGILTFMVLWDHFHQPAPFSTVVYTDTYLFIMISGFSTALQLRITPAFETTPTGTLVLKERKKFNWRNFLATRAQGLYPILWLALLVNAPYWHFQNTDHRGRAYSQHASGLQKQRGPVAACTFLYIIGLQSWIPECQSIGPDNVVYASYIIVCFLVYSLLRYYFHHLQNAIMKSRSASYVLPFSAQSEKSHDVESQTAAAIGHPPSISERLANLVTTLSYNRAGSISTAVFVSIFWFVFVSIPFIAIVGKPVGVILFEFYFLDGVAAASVMEMWFYILWKPKAGTQTSAVADVVMQPNIISWRRNFFSKNRHTSTAAADDPSIIKQSQYQHFQIMPCIWRFSPDMLAILSGFLLTPLGSLKHSPWATFLQFTVLPWILLVYLVIAFLQRDEARKNITRYCFESSLLNYLGYISYPMYVFQVISVNWYLPLIVHSIGSNRNEFVQNAYKLNTDWFTSINYGWRLLAIIILSGICWLIQKYYQDKFVLWLYSTVSAYYENSVRSIK